MPPTHNKLKNIERTVFSKEASSLNMKQLAALRDELMETYEDANNYTQSRDTWHTVDKQIKSLIELLPQPKQPWYSLFLKHPIISAVIASLIILLVNTYFSTSGEKQEHKSQESNNQTLKSQDQPG